MLALSISVRCSFNSTRRITTGMGWSGQCQNTEGGGTHSLEGADPWTGQGVKMMPSSCVGVALELVVVCMAQKNPSREGLVRTVSGHGRRVLFCSETATTE